MKRAEQTFIAAKPVWYAIIYDGKGRKRDYLDGFDSLPRAEVWLLESLSDGERGEIATGHTLRATGDATYYKDGDCLRREDEAQEAMAAA